ncbi:MAG TPA: hypothetical protein PLA94_32780 [Myxococcota bacterium]|nr:hypothetical protein [Myxococcota bacterium]
MGSEAGMMMDSPPEVGPMVVPKRPTGSGQSKITGMSGAGSVRVKVPLKS